MKARQACTGPIWEWDHARSWCENRFLMVLCIFPILFQFVQNFQESRDGLTWGKVKVPMFRYRRSNMWAKVSWTWCCNIFLRAARWQVSNKCSIIGRFDLIRLFWWSVAGPVVPAAPWHCENHLITWHHSPFSHCQIAILFCHCGPPASAYIPSTTWAWAHRIWPFLRKGAIEEKSGRPEKSKIIQNYMVS